MTYPSRTQSARQAESKARWAQQKELMRKVNERLSATLGIDHNELLRLIVDGKVEIKIKEDKK